MATTTGTIRVTTTTMSGWCVAERDMNKVIDLQSLYAAYCQCRRHKRRTVNAQHYEVALLDNLFNTLEALQKRSYSPARSMCFVAQKPKAREIHAAHFSDRVVHHWLVPRLEVLYEPVFIHDVYSNRLNKGTHAACDRLQAFMQAVGHQGWFMQLDIGNFFNSVDRPILFQQLQQRLRKARQQNQLSAEQAEILRWLVHRLLRHNTAAHSVYRGSRTLLQRVPEHKRLAHAGPYKGLPIGNLTSQFFANVYLNALDQFIKHHLKCRHYLRYVDDFILLAQSPEVLLQWRGQIETFLQQQLQLQLKEQANPKPVKSGADFLGYIVYPHYRLVRRRVVGNLRERLAAFQAQHIQGSSKMGYRLVLDADALYALRATLASYWGHFKHANSQRLCAALFRQYPWLALLFDAALQPRWQPAARLIVGYKSQLWFFRRQYPLAQLLVQRGTEQDKIAALPVLKKAHEPFTQSYTEPPTWVSRVIIREQGQLYNGLKGRIATCLIIQPGVLLCPYPTL
jgi:hypothetical protein